MGGTSAPPQVAAPDYSPMYALMGQRGLLQSEGLKNQGEFLQYAAGMIPSVSMPDISAQNKRILNQSIANAYQGRQVEEMFDPAAARMRKNLLPQIEALVSPEATAARQNQWLKTSGLQRILGSGTGLGTFGAAAIADAATEQGFQNMLRNIQIQQGVLGAAPSVGVNPSSAASQIEAAKAQQIANANAFQQNLLQQGSGLLNNALQSGQSLSNAAMQLTQQDLMNRYQANMQNAMNQYQAQQANQDMWGTLAGTGIGALGTIGGAALAGPIGSAVGNMVAKQAVSRSM